MSQHLGPFTAEDIEAVARCAYEAARSYGGNQVATWEQASEHVRAQWWTRAWDDLVAAIDSVAARGGRLIEVPNDPQQEEDHDLVRALAAIVRGADEQQEAEGGSTRHWVRDYFLPRLNAAGMTVAALGINEEAKT